MATSSFAEKHPGTNDAPAPEQRSGQASRAVSLAVVPGQSQWGEAQLTHHEGRATK